MDYEKLHKDTIAKLQEMVNSGKITVETACGICADFVPESEDERIMKSIIGFLITISSLKDGKTVSNKDFDSKAILEWVAWLEKQYADPIKEYWRGYNEGKQNVLDKYAELKKQGKQNLANSAKTCKVEQKPADKVETNLLTVERAKEMSPFMRSGFERNPAWSEEDKDILFRTINDLKFLRDTISIDPKYAVNIIDIEREITWLKSLRDRYTWKPSDEQMKALKEAVDEHFDIDGGALWHLYQELKNLKE